MKTVEDLINIFNLDLSAHNLITVSSTDFTLITHGSQNKCFPCSLALKGLGNCEGSEQTPAGLHRICEKIGDNAPVGAIFKSRIWTKEIWTPGAPDEDNMILSRILRLEGLEPYLNQGIGIDSFERYIYIHGTNQEEWVGKKHFSHGCVVLKNSDIISLFDLLKVGDYVYID